MEPLMSPDPEAVPEAPSVALMPSPRFHGHDDMEAQSHRSASFDTVVSNAVLPPVPASDAGSAADLGALASSTDDHAVPPLPPPAAMPPNEDTAAVPVDENSPPSVAELHAPESPAAAGASEAVPVYEGVPVPEPANELNPEIIQWADDLPDAHDNMLRAQRNARGYISLAQWNALGRPVGPDDIAEGWNSVANALRAQIKKHIQVMF